MYKWQLNVVVLVLVLQQFSQICVDAITPWYVVLTIDHSAACSTPRVRGGGIVGVGN